MAVYAYYTLLSRSTSDPTEQQNKASLIYVIFHCEL